MIFIGVVNVDNFGVVGKSSLNLVEEGVVFGLWVVCVELRLCRKR